MHLHTSPTAPSELLWGQAASRFGNMLLAFDSQSSLFRLSYSALPLEYPPAHWFAGGWAKSVYVNAPLKMVQTLAQKIEKQEEIPLSLCGSDFQLRVWRALLKIESGKICSYGDLAKKLRSAPRAIGQAVGANPIALLVPCHRVLNAQGELHGYAGGLKLKENLLRHEGWQAE